MYFKAVDIRQNLPCRAVENHYWRELGTSRESSPYWSKNHRSGRCNAMNRTQQSSKVHIRFSRNAISLFILWRTWIAMYCQKIWNVGRVVQSWLWYLKRSTDTLVGRRSRKRQSTPRKQWYDVAKPKAVYIWNLVTLHIRGEGHEGSQTGRTSKDKQEKHSNYVYFSGSAFFGRTRCSTTTTILARGKRSGYQIGCQYKSLQCECQWHRPTLASAFAAV